MPTDLDVSCPPGWGDDLNRPQLSSSRCLQSVACGEMPVHLHSAFQDPPWSCSLGAVKMRRKKCTRVKFEMSLQSNTSWNCEACAPDTIYIKVSSSSISVWFMCLSLAVVLPPCRRLDCSDWTAALFSQCFLCTSCLAPTVTVSHLLSVVTGSCLEWKPHGGRSCFQIHGSVPRDSGRTQRSWSARQINWCGTESVRGQREVGFADPRFAWAKKSVFLHLASHEPFPACVDSAEVREHEEETGSLRSRRPWRFCLFSRRSRESAQKWEFLPLSRGTREQTGWKKQRFRSRFGGSGRVGWDRAGCFALVESSCGKDCVPAGAASCWLRRHLPHSTLQNSFLKHSLTPSPSHWLHVSGPRGPGWNLGPQHVSQVYLSAWGPESRLCPRLRLEYGACQFYLEIGPEYIETTRGVERSRRPSDHETPPTLEPERGWSLRAGLFCAAPGASPKCCARLLVSSDSKCLCCGHPAIVVGNVRRALFPDKRQPWIYE